MDKIVNSETVEKVKETMPNEELLYDIAELFKVFGDCLLYTSPSQRD